MANGSDSSASGQTRGKVTFDASVGPGSTPRTPSVGPRRIPRVDSNADAGKLMGLDIGGTLVKLVFFEPKTQPQWCDGRLRQAITSSVSYGDTGRRDADLEFEDAEKGGTFHFLYFASDKVPAAVTWIKERGLDKDVHKVPTAGGGAHKYATLFQESLGIRLEPLDELAVVVMGISWMVRRVKEEVYWLDPEASMQRRSLEPTSLFPFLLVNIGSGVSIVRVDGPDDFKRVSGTALGGGTFWGLCNLMTGCKSFSEAMELAAAGDASSVNLTVGDIYGGDYNLPTGGVLPASLTASFFAKAGSSRAALQKSDILRALNHMVAQNICQLAYLNSQLQGTERVIFTGNFLRHNSLAQETIARQMRSASAAHANGTEMKALFLKHEGYFGAIGSLLQQADGSVLRKSSRKETGQLKRPRFAWHLCCICR